MYVIIIYYPPWSYNLYPSHSIILNDIYLPHHRSKRRDQEASYIEELAELIAASLSNPESLNMKPDKCARLQETINQFKRVKQQQGMCGVVTSSPGILSYLIAICASKSRLLRFILKSWCKSAIYM